VYDLSTYFGFLGGIISGWISVVMAVQYFFSRHWFYINAIQELFFVNTRDDDLMTVQKNPIKIAK